MGDYTPVYVPSKVVTLTVSTAVVGGDLLEISGSGTVRKCATAASVAYIGVAGEDTAVNGRVTVYCRGFVHESVASGAITAGQQLNTADSTAAGKQVAAVPAVSTPTPTDVTNTRAIIGVALTSAADNAKVRWMEY